MRIKALTVFIGFLFFILSLGLFYTQVVRYDFYKTLSERNRIRVVPLEAPRGRIYDRDGQILVTNRIAFNLAIISQEVKDPEELAEKLNLLLGLSKNDLLKKMKDARRAPYAPFVISEDIGKENAIKIEEARSGMPGIIVAIEPMRSYMENGFAAHLTGYLGKISESELKKYKSYGYQPQDVVGKDGIERYYNEYLRGKSGGYQVEVDSRGRQLRVLALKETEPGRDLHLTINSDLQKLSASLLKNDKGAIVAINPQTGEVLAMASSPGFDPSVFVTPNNNKEIFDLLKDKESFPLVNRAVGASYPPGSIFKVVVALAALETKALGPDSILSCSGSHRVGNRSFHCWKEKGHGPQDMKTAIKNSCNVFFYQAGLTLGADPMAEYAFRFGLGKKTGIDLPGEASGLVPSTEWKKKTIRQAWFKGETANYAIGQGYLLTTPLQISVMISAIANGGSLVEPFIVNKIEDVPISHRDPRDLGFKKENIDLVKEGLRMVVNEPHGTGFYARSKEVIVSGKTGTAQNPQGESHAWFAGFAPHEEPKICVVVFLENGGKGGLKPARYAKEIIEEAKKGGLT